ncbi:3-hydroxyisobutyryl-CoA hydrolase-like protein 5 [Bienertia sinuspersici]
MSLTSFVGFGIWVLALILGAGRAFSAGGHLRMVYAGKNSKDSNLEVVCRMYWLCYHIHPYKKTQVALVNGISMGGSASLMVFATPEAGIGFHTDVPSHTCILGCLVTWLYLAGEFLALTGTRLNGKQLVAAGLENHFVALEREVYNAYNTA